MITLVQRRATKTRSLALVAFGLLTLLSSAVDAQPTAAKSFIGAMSPVWSPDGQHIAFLKTAPGGMDGAISDLYLIKVDGSGAVKLTTGALYNPLWSPNSKQIAIQHTYPNYAISGLDVIDVATATTVTVTKDGSEPTWSVDGKQLYFLREDGKLYVVNVDGSSLHSVLPNSVPTMMSYAWSPDGKQLTFFNQPDPQDSYKLALYFANADGSGLRQIDIGSLSGLAWSPDSRQLATISHCGGQVGLCLFSADGSAMHSIVKDDATPGWSSWVTWSPNGQLIAYNQSGQIALIAPDGSNRATLTSTATTDASTNVLSPSWSPDSKHLVFQAQYVLTRISGDPLIISELYTVNANGMNITLLEGLDSLP
ncbi:MAG TPA: hypothetical protein VKQ72_11185 [Aggregatilineales bacterium]|nr:hypothetical protein [Aggregatilineales bacterium]